MRSMNATCTRLSVMKPGKRKQHNVRNTQNRKVLDKTKDEIERMLELETLMQGGRFIAKKTCEFLPDKDE
jgi:hypothetical protein